MSARSRAPISKCRGFTLAEVMVAAFLSSLILYVIVTLLVPVLRLSTRGAGRLDLDARAYLTQQRLIRSLQSTSRAGVGVGVAEGVTVLTVHPLQGALANNQQQWAPSLTVSTWANKKLTETSFPLDSPPQRATTLPVQLVLGALGGQQVSFQVQDLTLFEVVLGSGPRVDFALTFEKGKEKLEVRRTVYLANNSQ